MRCAWRREFSEYANRLDEPSRRAFIQLMGASLGLAGVVGCVQQPQETIVAYVQSPEQIIPGKPLYYATAIQHDDCGTGVLVESQMGRPIKVEGNPLHPAVPEIMRAANEAASENRLRLGATDAFAQATVLSLYDPDRSQTVRQGGQIDTWESFTATWQSQLKDFEANEGRGLRVLSEMVVSPTLAALRRDFLAKFPGARWHEFQPINHDNSRLGFRLAFGDEVAALHRVERADVILSLDADFLVDGPMHLQNARGFANRRRFDARQSVAAADMNRLYVVETRYSLTGAAADHRWPLSLQGIARFAARLAQALGLDLPFDEKHADDEAFHERVQTDWIEVIVDDLRQGAVTAWCWPDAANLPKSMPWHTG